MRATETVLLRHKVTDKILKMTMLTSCDKDNRGKDVSSISSVCVVDSDVCVTLTK